MRAFCPSCGALLDLRETGECYAFVCPNCDYKLNVTSKISQRVYPKQKEIEETVGGREHWTSAEITSERCPKCSHDRATYQQLQTRSGDEAMTIFYRCVQCDHRWKE